MYIFKRLTVQPVFAMVIGLSGRLIATMVERGGASDRRNKVRHYVIQFISYACWREKLSTKLRRLNLIYLPDQRHEKRIFEKCLQIIVLHLFQRDSRYRRFLFADRPRAFQSSSPPLAGVKKVQSQNEKCIVCTAHGFVRRATSVDGRVRVRVGLFRLFDEVREDS